MTWIRLVKQPQRMGLSGKETWIKIDNIYGIEEAWGGSLVKTVHEVLTVSEAPRDIVEEIVEIARVASE